MKRKAATPRVFLNASVILAGLASPSGGSGKILSWARARRIYGIVSEIILDEVARHRAKLGIGASKLRNFPRTFHQVVPPPKAEVVVGFETLVIDVGDAHVLASCKEWSVDFLVTLDQKHLLVLKPKIRGFSIVTPKQLIELLS